ncbi:AraC family transcriptional regulator [Mesorhizobium sp. B2-4-6]|uniref:AraC family transcriptional regulator n=1 Tax=Mesorhizobium sp. B2-4-6 TaxID=2589943 RepID=UPI001125E4E4|nr:AraC family transcriptional regulator [Mesorhizobium sp. B2-4-6]TPL36000.1 AraC family transcriptional regulator [Mesorhizobium sp. B2-4-6]
MIATPDLYAGTPDRRSPAEPDLLSEMLKSLRLTGSVFLSGCFSAPFGIVSPKYYEPGTPMAHLRHISIFHLIVTGSCTFEAANGERRDIAAGDLLFLPFADRHRFWKGEPLMMAEAGQIVQPSRIEGMWTVNYGGGGDELRMVCGFLESSEFLFAPVFRTLPTLIVEHTSQDKVGELIAATVREINLNIEASMPGSQAVLGRLMELLFVEVLRRHVARLPTGAKGWFAALNDPIVLKTLQLLHADPAHHWTVDRIADKTGSSRTVVAERFKTLLGRPPIEYLTSWRIQLAGERLRVGRESLSSISTGVGYQSEAAFNRAFKRVTGITPGKWRERAGSLAGFAIGSASS